MNGQPFERYWAVVMDNPIRKGEGHMAYIIRIAELVAQQPLPSITKDWPKPEDYRAPYRDSEDGLRLDVDGGQP